MVERFLGRIGWTDCIFAKPVSIRAIRSRATRSTPGQICNRSTKLDHFCAATKSLRGTLRVCVKYCRLKQLKAKQGIVLWRTPVVLALHGPHFTHRQTLKRTLEYCIVDLRLLTTMSQEAPPDWYLQLLPSSLPPSVRLSLSHQSPFFPSPRSPFIHRSGLRTMTPASARRANPRFPS